MKGKHLVGGTSGERKKVMWTLRGQCAHLGKEGGPRHHVRVRAENTKTILKNMLLDTDKWGKGREPFCSLAS
jgi:hypothetical protein